MTAPVQTVTPIEPTVISSGEDSSPEQGTSNGEMSTTFQRASSNGAKEQRQSQSREDYDCLLTIQQHRAGSTDLLDLSKLDELSNDETLPQEVRDAYAHLRDSPELKAKLDGVTKDAALQSELNTQMTESARKFDLVGLFQVGLRAVEATEKWADPECATDGKASNDDLNKLLVAPEMDAARTEQGKVDADTAWVGSTLLKYDAYLPETGLDLSRLDEYVQDDTLPPDLLKAFEMMRDTPEIGQSIASKSSGDAGGFITSADLQAVQTAKAPADAKAMWTIAAYRPMGSEDLNFSTLDALSKDATLPQELRDAYAHLRDNPDLLAKVDGATATEDARELAHDGVASADDLHAMEGDPALFDEWQKLDASARAEVDGLIAQWKGGNLSDDELQAKRTEPRLSGAWEQIDAEGSMPILKDKEAADLHAVSTLQANLQSPALQKYLRPKDERSFRRDIPEEKITYDDLLVISKDTEVPASVREACAYLHANPDLFNDLSGDGVLSINDLTEMRPAQLQASSQKMAYSEGEIQTLRTLQGHGGRVPETLNVTDLDKLANDESLPQDLREAYAYLRDHPELTTRIDNAHDGSRLDGVIGRGLEATYNDPRLIESNRKQAEVYTNNFVSSDATDEYAVPHEIDMGDACREIYLYSDSLPDTLDTAALQKLVDKGADNACPPQLRAAAQYFLDHPEEFAKVAPGGSVSRGELLNNVSQHINLRQNEQDAVDTVVTQPDEFSDEDGNITRDSLTTTANDESNSAEVRAAAAEILSNSMLFGLLDNANKGHEAGRKNRTDDGVISREGLEAWQKKETKENRKPPPKPQPKPPTDRIEAQAQYDMMCGTQNDPEVKEVRGGPPKHKMLGKVLGIVGKVLDYTKMAIDVVSGFLPPPFSLGVAALGMGLSAVNNFGVKAGAALANGMSRREAYLEAGKNFGIDAAGSLLGLVPGGAIAKAGATAMRVGGNVGKAVATNVIKEGAEIGAKMGMNAAKTVVTEGAQFGASKGATRFTQLRKEGMEFFGNRGLTNAGNSGDELGEVGAKRGATSGGKAGETSPGEATDYWKLQGAKTKSGNQTDELQPGGKTKAGEPDPKAKRKTETEEPEDNFKQRQKDEGKDAFRSEVSDVADAPVAAVTDVVDTQVAVVKESVDAQIAPAKEMLEAEVKTFKSSFTSMAKEQAKELITMVPGGEQALQLFSKGKALFTKGSAMKDDALEQGTELSASSGATTAREVGEAGEDGLTSARAAREGRMADEGDVPPKKTGKNDGADTEVEPKAKKKTREEKTDDKKKTDDDPKTKDKKKADDDKKKKKEEEERKKKEAERALAEALRRALIAAAASNLAATNATGAMLKTTQDSVDVTQKQAAKLQADEQARIAAEDEKAVKAQKKEVTKQVKTVEKPRAVIADAPIEVLERPVVPEQARPAQAA